MLVSLFVAEVSVLNDPWRCPETGRFQVSVGYLS